MDTWILDTCYLWNNYANPPNLPYCTTNRLWYPQKLTQLILKPAYFVEACLLRLTDAKGVEPFRHYKPFAYSWEAEKKCSSAALVLNNFANSNKSVLQLDLLEPAFD